MNPILSLVHPKRADIVLNKWNKPNLSIYLSIYIVIYKALCFDVAQGRMNGAPNETQTLSCRFSSLAC